jgi:hypothetical protein
MRGADCLLPRKSGQQWWTSQDLETALMQFPAIRALTQRSLDLLIVHEVKFPEKERRLIDVSQSASRAKVSTTENVLPCCKPNMMLWLTDLCRPLTGPEAFRAQGISWGPEGDKKLIDFSNELLLDLAGNGFHAGCCAATFLSVMSALGVAVKRGQGQKVHSIRANSLFAGAALVDDDDGSDADLNSMW